MDTVFAEATRQETSARNKPCAFRPWERRRLPADPPPEAAPDPGDLGFLRGVRDMADYMLVCRFGRADFAEDLQAVAAAVAQHNAEPCNDGWRLPPVIVAGEVLPRPDARPYGGLAGGGVHESDWLSLDGCSFSGAAEYSAWLAGHTRGAAQLAQSFDEATIDYLLYAFPLGSSCGLLDQLDTLLDALLNVNTPAKLEAAKHAVEEFCARVSAAEIREKAAAWASSPAYDADYETWTQAWAEYKRRRQEAVRLHDEEKDRLLSEAVEAMRQELEAALPPSTPPADDSTGNTPPPEPAGHGGESNSLPATRAPQPLSAQTPGRSLKDWSRADVEKMRRGAEDELAARDGKGTLPAIVDAASFTTSPMPEPPEVVHGVLHRGSKAVYGGPSKAYKSWTLLDLCLAVATGGEWFGFSTTAGPVLYLNFELQPFAVHQRLKAIAGDRRCGIPRALHLWNLRGFGRPLSELLPELLRQIEGEQYALIVPDPIYKTLNGRDENAAGDIGDLCSELDRLAVETGAAVAFGAHFAKGNASGKEHLDRVSGSGVWTRDPDAILTSTRHEKEGAFALEMTLRNFPPVDPFVIRWEFPRMRRDAQLDPERLKLAKGAGKMARPSVGSYTDKALSLFRDGALKVQVFRARLESLVDTRERSRSLYNLLIAEERIEEFRVRAKNKHEAWIGTPEQIESLRQRELPDL